MFPVTLETTAGRKMTYCPPCYGFIRQDEWECDQESGCSGVGLRYNSPYRPESEARPFGSYRLAQYSGFIRSDDCLELSDLKAIWNSGTHVPSVGLDNNGKPIAWQHHEAGIVYDENEVEGSRRKSNLERWCEENCKEISMQEVMEGLQSWVDKDSESALLWHSDGYMGVRADIPCDRAMFYLMINRELNTPDYYERSKMFLDNWFIKGNNPMVSFLVSRLISKMSHAFRDPSVEYTGNSGDSCIIPHYIICNGLGKLYSEPSQISWLQHSYSSGTGHHRDEDLEELQFTHPKCSEYSSSSLFLAVSQLEQKEGGLYLGDKLAFPVGLALCAEAIDPKYRPSYPLNTYRIGTTLDDAETAEMLVVPREEWDTVILKLLMDNE